MTARRVLLAAVPILCLLVQRPAFSEWVYEDWRTPFGRPFSVSVDTYDGSCWAAVGTRVMHFAADGTLLGKRDEAWPPTSVCVNQGDRTCWVTYAGPSGEGDQVAQLYQDDTEPYLYALRTVGGFDYPMAVAVDPVDGSVWVANTGGLGDEIVHLTIEGSTVHWQIAYGFQGPVSLSVDPYVPGYDGTCWVADAGGNVVVQLGVGTGGVLQEVQRFPGFNNPWCVSVDTYDGSIWVADSGNDQVVWVAADGSAWFAVPGFNWPLSVSVNTYDGSCWAADTYHLQMVHLDYYGEVLWAGGNYGAFSVSADSVDDSCWVADTFHTQVVHLADTGAPLSSSQRGIGSLSVSVDPVDHSGWAADTDNDRILHLAGTGDLVAESPGFYSPYSVSVDPYDGYCWAADSGNGQLVLLAPDGSEFDWTGGFNWPWSVSVNAAPPTPDHPELGGSWWLADTGNNRVVHSGATIPGFYHPGSVSVDAWDGSCWVADTDNNEVVHLSAAGAEVLRKPGFLGPYSVSADSGDGSCWVADSLNWQVVHLAPEGAELQRLSWFVEPHAVAVNPGDGSCWVADTYGDGVVHLAADGSVLTWLWPSRFYTPESVAVDTTDGSCWVADYGNGEIAHLVVVLFSDVPRDHWAYREITTCYYRGIVSGFGDGTYRPTDSVNRGQMAAYVARALVDGDAAVPPGPPTPTFTDVLTDHPYYKYIECCAANEIVGGFGDGTYRPLDPVNRGQMAAYIARAIYPDRGELPNDLPGYVLPPVPTFPADVPTTHPFYKHVEYIVSQGVVQGYGDGTYRPDNIVNRGLMAIYIQRAFGLPI